MSINRINIKELPESFTKSGRTYNMVASSSKAYLYEVVSSRPDSLFYEVFMKKTANVYDFERKVTTDQLYVKYPSNEHFGKWGWCVSRGADLEAAYIKANEVYKLLNEAS